MLKYLLIPLLLLSAEAGQCQAFNYQYYDEVGGVNSLFVYTLDQDSHGFLLVGTSNGLYRYNGISCDRLTVDNGLADNYITCSYADAFGTIWYGHYNGKISRYRNGELTSVNTGDYCNSLINDITEDTSGMIWGVSQHDGLLRVDRDLHVVQYTAGLEEFALYSLECSDNGGFWIGTDVGLMSATWKSERNLAIRAIPELASVHITCISRESRERYLIGTDGSGVHQLTGETNHYKVQSLECAGHPPGSFDVTHLYEDHEKRCWISTTNAGLLCCSEMHNGVWKSCTQYTPCHQQTDCSIRRSYVDREGNIWMGTEGSGLVRVLDDAFSMYRFSTDPDSSTTECVFSRHDTLWIGSRGFIRICAGTPDHVIAILGKDEGIPNGSITTLAIDDQNAIWIGTEDRGLFVHHPGRKNSEPFVLGQGSNTLHINHLAYWRGLLTCSTNSGLYQVAMDGTIDHLSISNGLPFNTVQYTYTDSRNRTWLGLFSSAIWYIEDGILKNLQFPEMDRSIQATCFTEDNTGRIWIGTAGSGVLVYHDGKTENINEQSGLYSNYCYSIAVDAHGKMWVTHRAGLSRIDSATLAAEMYHRITENEGVLAENQSACLPSGIVLFPCDQGILTYDPHRDGTSPVEPLIRILSVTINDSLFSSDREIRLPSGAYKLVIEYTGISLKNTEKVSYQYFLEGFDTEWGEPTTEREAVYRKLGPGNYTFRIRAFNSDGVGGSHVSEVHMYVAFPFWQRWWFIISCLALGSMTVRVVLMRREKFLRANQEYLQNELNARTKEVIDQKELLEIQNKDIKDSILYAKNIQKAMLPSPDSLKQHFPESFVYYKPRDIVSGDFYWVHREGDMLLLACADCTGHGVPGAFMSLIGSTLLKEVSQKDDHQTPRQILMALDNELKDLINRKDHSFTVEDGIDISLLEIDMATKYLRVSSANRPVVIYRDGTRNEIRGDRYAVGGPLQVENKPFALHEMQLHKGDVIYLFSDGITDQFGGTEGKKMKRSGLFALLDTIYHLPMEHQRKLIRDQFYSWKGVHDQMDDVIFIGVRL